MTDERFDDNAPLPPELARLEATLRALPTPREPDWSRVSEPRQPIWVRQRWNYASLAIAAALIIVSALSWNMRQSWNVSVIRGSVRATGMSFAGRLGEGGTLVTGSESQAALEVPGFGTVKLEGKCRLKRMRGDAPGVRALLLEHGTVEAQITAPPRLFVIGTSVGRAVDLGCAYRLSVDDHGVGKLEVTQGRVVFEEHGRESLLPAGLWAPLSGSGAGVPRRTHASDRFLALLAETDHPQCNNGELSVALRAAEPSDAITLWHMLPRVMGAQRREVAERIAQLIEVPADIPIERIVALDPAALEAWWNALGVGPLQEWKSPGAGLKNAR